MTEKSHAYDNIICGWCLKPECDGFCRKPGRLVISPTQYDDLAAQGFDMRGFAKNEQVPE